MSAVVRSRPETGARAPLRERRRQPLRGCVRSALELYFMDLEGHQASDLYQMVIGEVEQAMLECVMAHAGGNQSRAAQVLGINRGTLRKKLKHYGLL